MATGYHQPYRGFSRGNPRGRGRGRRSQHGDRLSGTVILGFNALQKLREKDPDDIVLDLASDKCLPAFQVLLGRTDLSQDMVELVMEVLARSCDSNSPQYFNKLVVEIPKSLFVILNLKTYITRMCMQRNITGNSKLFLQRTVRLFSEILKRIPSSFESLPLGDLEQTVNLLAARGQIDAEIIQNVEQLRIIKEESLEKERRKEELEVQRRNRGRNPGREPVGPPPEDFREMTIIPQYEDIYSQKEPYLRKNIVEGRYDDLDHYLDVQFRLLREDFLRPLREGIVNLVSHGIEEKQGMFKDIRVYKNVKILYPECSNSGLLHHIEFDNSRLKRVRWENSKRLIFGSLLCLSKDNFQTFVFATVANRDPRELGHGKVTVQFMDSTFDTQDFSRKNIYQMVETTAYFEAYNPILTGLQQTEADDLPFQRYLVECNREINPPKYLVHNRFRVQAPSFDFSSILCDAVSSERSYTSRFRQLSLYDPYNAAQYNNVPVLEVHRWPSKERLGVDESQYKALQIALTKEVAVIQGPPGTGKTYLGLKIAKILLNNTEKWIQGLPTVTGRHREVNQTPILVICYTNHALDQFLEGIYDFHGNQENKIVRIGGRSKSEKLKECNLSAIKYRSSKKAPTYVRRSMFEVYNKLEGVKNKMETSSNVLKKCWQNILYEKTLLRTGVVDDRHYRSLMKPFMTFGGGKPEQGSVVLQWLNLVTAEMHHEETVIFGEDNLVTFNGRQMANYEGLPFAGTDFSLSANIKTLRGGSIICQVPERRIWRNDSKALYVDATGVVKFTTDQNILCESHARVNDDKWHEIAVVYSDEDKRLTLYVDKRIESIQAVDLPGDNPDNTLKIGIAPILSPHVIQNFVGTMKNFVYYRSTKYSEMVMGDVNVEYEIEFMQEQRKVDDADDMLDKLTVRSTPKVDDFDVIDPSKLVNSSGEWQVQDKRRARNKITFEIRKQLQSEDVMSDTEASRIRDVWTLQIRDRWRLYRKWVKDISQQHQNTITAVQDEYKKGMKELQELRNAQSYELLREAHVIGMTTTGAAKYRDLLHRIKPKITIVEEAAEVLESHIVTALTGGCEHLILIGDHKQLRPKPTVFDLGVNYQLDISLFERLVENGMPFARLRAQHRMRPEISVMMRPIYDNLLDHESVLNFENIRGINKNIFFVDHQVREDAVDENRSHSNLHEAKFIGSLCNYLLQQGYSPSQITVLTPYTGQLFHLKKFIPNVKDLRICVVDNFQGEENDIILLSLVRSQEISTNDRRDMRRLIGFLAIDNRICVSLSRAKKGFFCIGNLTLMRSANDLWSKILDDMEKRGSVGKALPLACQNHPTTITRVADAIDFNKAPNGGCNVLCQARLACGHRCEQICHPRDPQHKEYDCRKQCAKTCERGHPCPRLCYQDCHKCMVPVSKVVPSCFHSMQMPCHQEPSTFRCTAPCPKKLSCGHVCPNKCGDPCARKCQKEVKKTWSPCGHSNKTKCYVDPTVEECPHPCGTLLKCEHICSGTCGECRQGRLHKPCSSRCGRTRFCDHECKVPCTRNCPPCPEICPNKCSHSKCRNRCGDPCIECKEPCDWRCKHLRCTKPCGQLCDRPRCNEPCHKRLKKCGHLCAGLCGEPCPKKCLKCDEKELREILFGYEDEKDARFIELADCGHVFEVKGMDQYMDTQEKELKKGQSTSIQMIKCPRCKKAIRTSLRYGNTVKTILRDFEDVKRTISSANGTTRAAFLMKVRQDVTSASLESDFPDEVHSITQYVETNFTLTKDQQNVVENQVQFLKFMMKLKAILKQAEPVENRHTLFRSYLAGLSSDADGPEIRLLKQELEVLSKWVIKKRDRFSEQELEDFNDELIRAWIFFSNEALKLEIKKRKIDLSDQGRKCLAYVNGALDVGMKLDEKQKENCPKYLKYVIERNKSLSERYTTVTEEEKKIIVKAIGLKQGHWFKCPKGHIYCIGECGGATEEGNCPECGSRIGGTQHRLLSDNSLASDMDGARFAAWSDTANNIGNWDLRHLR